MKLLFWSWVWTFHRIQGVITKEVYKEIIEDVMIPYARRNFGRGYLLQQGNDPKTLIQHCEKLFQENKREPDGMAEFMT